MPHPLFERHQKTIEDAVSAIRNRTYWSAYPEAPSGKIYGETAKDDGEAAFKARLNKPFELDQPCQPGTIGDESSPYGFALGIKYPKCDVDALIRSGRAAIPAWRDASVEARVGVCAEILARINKRSFEIANAVMHTTGQAFMMAFQAGGPHAQDRGLEAVAYAYEEMRKVPQHATWQKQVSKTDVVTLQKSFRLVPRGVATVIGCSTFPTWNSYPGLFASLATGNAVIVKPHPGAILPLAISVQIARETLKEAGFDPNLVTLLVDTQTTPMTKELVIRPEIKIVDYTGSSQFGEWIEKNAPQALVYTEKAGVNSTIIDSTNDIKALTGNLAFSLCLYSGQMCTTPQNIFIPKSGISVNGEQKSFDEVAKAIVGAVDWWLSDAKRAPEVLGAIQNEKTLERIDKAAHDGGDVVRPASAIKHEVFPEARIRSPLILKTQAANKNVYMREMFGPIVYLIATDDTNQSIKLAADSAKQHGAITWGVYSTNREMLRKAEDAAVDAGVAISCNLTGQIFVNQSAAFSDYHVTGANPSGNATLCDAAFVANRFRIVPIREIAQSV